jgi:hypothetical protein
MEQSSSTSKTKPLELATLAARICPRICVKSPAKAIAAAERLLQEAEAASERAHQEEGRKDFERYEAELPLVDWLTALKEITGQKRRDRAVERFLAFVEHDEPGKSKGRLDSFKREGITPIDMFGYHEAFKNWLKGPKRKKGKQGRRKSDHDGRLRTELVGLVPTKPRKFR